MYAFKSSLCCVKDGLKGRNSGNRNAIKYDAVAVVQEREHGGWQMKGHGNERLDIWGEGERYQR